MEKQNEWYPSRSVLAEESGTWTVYDCQSGCAAALNGVLQVGLGLNEADDLTAVLSRVELQRFASRNADRLDESNDFPALT